jgi:hypothetical protein
LRIDSVATDKLQSKARENVGGNIMRLRNLLVVITGLSFSSLANPAFSAPFTNGSFETPAVPSGGFTLFNTGSTLITGWTVVGAPGSNNVAIVSGAFQQSDNGVNFIFPAQNGSQWLDLTGISNTLGEGVSQSFDTIAGHQYSVSFFVGNISDPGGIFGTSSTVNVQLNGNPTAILTAVNSLVPPTSGGNQTMAYEQFMTTFVASSALTTLAFLNGDPVTDTSNALDNITVTDLGAVGAVPLPSALPLFATGLGALGLLGWRRKKTAAG